MASFAMLLIIWAWLTASTTWWGQPILLDPLWWVGQKLFGPLDPFLWSGWEMWLTGPHLLPILASLDSEEEEEAPPSNRAMRRQWKHERQKQARDAQRRRQSMEKGWSGMY